MWPTALREQDALTSNPLPESVWPSLRFRKEFRPGTAAGLSNPVKTRSSSAVSTGSDVWSGKTPGPQLKVNQQKGKNDSWP